MKTRPGFTAKHFVLLLFGLFLCACSKAPTPTPALAKAAPPPQLAIQPVKPVGSQTGAGEIPAKSTWEVFIAEFPDSHIEELGLAKLFEQPLRTNTLAGAIFQTNAVFQLASRETNVQLTTAPAAHTGLCSTGSASNLIQRCKQVSGVDFLTFPPLTLENTNAVEFDLHSPMTLELTKGSPGANPRMANVPLGIGVHLRLTGMDGDSVVVGLDADIAQFSGFAAPQESMAAPGQSARFDLALFSATTSLATDEVLLIGGTIFPKIVRHSDRVVYLSDIPIVGGLFVKASSETNYVRTVVMLRRKVN